VVWFGSWMRWGWLWAGGVGAWVTCPGRVLAGVVMVGRGVGWGVVGVWGVVFEVCGVGECWVVFGWGDGLVSLMGAVFGGWVGGGGGVAFEGCILCFLAVVCG